MGRARIHTYYLFLGNFSKEIALFISFVLVAQIFANDVEVLNETDESARENKCKLHMVKIYLNRVCS